MQISNRISAVIGAMGLIIGGDLCIFCSYLLDTIPTGTGTQMHGTNDHNTLLHWSRLVLKANSPLDEHMISEVFKWPMP